MIIIYRLHNDLLILSFDSKILLSPNIFGTFRKLIQWLVIPISFSKGIEFPASAFSKYYINRLKIHFALISMNGD